jgi:ACS family D-galactonate transporter-like MFS transporter
VNTQPSIAAASKQAQPPGSGPAAPAPDRRRFVVLALLAIGTMINYLDRTVLGIAAPSLSKELALRPQMLGVVFSAFSWAYAAAQIPGGILLDRLGSRLTYFLAVAFWSLFTLLQGAAVNLATLLGMRLGLGLAEAPCFPTNSRVVAAWFPQRETARATAIYTLGEYLGLACFGPALYWITSHFGWRAMFVIVGLAGIAFAVLWWIVYRDPGHHDAAQTEPAPATAAPRNGQTAFSWAQVRRLLRFRQIWGACIGQFGGNSTLVFFLTWFPTYLASARHMEWIKAGIFSILPFAAGGLGVLCGGWFSDFLLKRTHSANLARKLPVIVGLLGASVIIAANYVDSDAVVIAVMSVAFFSQGMTGLGWALITDIAPLKLPGVTGGIFGFAANIAGITTPLVIGVVVGATGSFEYALAYIGAVALLGAIGYIFILGDVRRLEM